MLTRFDEGRKARRFAGFAFKEQLDFLQLCLIRILNRQMCIESSPYLKAGVRSVQREVWRAGSTSSFSRSCRLQPLPEIARILSRRVYLSFDVSINQKELSGS